VVLEPRLALLGSGVQYCIYRNQSVPEIVDAIPRRHGLLGYADEHYEALGDPLARGY